MTKHALLSFALRKLPVPGSYLAAVLNLARCEPSSVPVPQDCRDRWGTFSIRITNPTDLIQRQILFQGYFEYYETVFMRKYLRPGQTFVDIGANIGWHTLLAASCVGPSGRVIAFEPVASTFDDLSQNVRLNGFTNVTLRRVALGEKPGECDIFQCADGNDGGNSLYASDTNIPIERVTIENGDAFFQAHGMGSIDLCKIDVEGAEFDVLNGLKETLAARKIHCLLIEANPAALQRAGHSAEELIALLLGYGFRLTSPGSSRPVAHLSDIRHGQNLIATLD